MLKQKYSLGCLFALAVTMMACSSDDTDVLEPQLPITAENIKGNWQLASLNGASINPEVAYFYISLKDSTSFELYETMNSGAYHHRTGEYTLDKQGRIHGYYHHTDSMVWNQSYQVSALTMTSMTWIGTQTNEQQVFTKVTTAQ